MYLFVLRAWLKVVKRPITTGHQNSFSPTWKQRHYLCGVMTQPAGADLSRCCLMETKCMNGSQSCEKSFLTLIESRFCCANRRHVGGSELRALPDPC